MHEIVNLHIRGIPVFGAQVSACQLKWPIGKMIQQYINEQANVLMFKCDLRYGFAHVTQGTQRRVCCGDNFPDA